MNDRTNPTTEPGNTKTITEEDESYTKTTNGPPIAADNTSENAIVKVLGSIWNTETDQFTFDLVDLSQHASLLLTTKRSLLRISAKIFDPLGLLSPFTIQWKVLFQELCIERTDWDEQLRGDYLKQWKTLIIELQTLNRVCIPRSFFDYTSGKLKAAELHCFSDSSEKAYAASIYVRSIYEDGRIDVKLIASKTKVTPLKNQSIPKLELLGATILVRLAKTVQNALPQKLKTVFWVDSITVLCWIKNLKPWKQYIMSRVQEITTPDSWRFCPGNQNPADIPSSGMSASELVSEKRWWNSPEFLCKEERQWPQEDNSQADNENAWKELIQNPATTTHTLISSTQVMKVGVHQIIDVNHYQLEETTTTYCLRSAIYQNIK